MPCYQNKTDEQKIRVEIQKNLKNEEKAEDVVQLVANLCWETDVSNDPMSQWLSLLGKHVPKVQKWSGSTDLIEIYPSGTSGVGRSDRMWLQVGQTQVALVKAYESDH